MNDLEFHGIILLFIPMYNCQKQIVRVLGKLTEEICYYISEIIIVNNRSTDNEEMVVLPWIPVPLSVTGDLRLLSLPWQPYFWIRTRYWQCAVGYGHPAAFVKFVFLWTFDCPPLKVLWIHSLGSLYCFKRWLSTADCLWKTAGSAIRNGWPSITDWVALKLWICIGIIISALDRFWYFAAIQHCLPLPSPQCCR